MNRNRKYLPALAAAAMMMIIMTVTAFAGFVPFASDNIRTANVTLTGSGTSLTATVTVSGKSICERIGVSSFSIQEKRDGAWVTVKSAVPGYNSNSMNYSNTITFTGLSGREYRARASCYATLSGTTSTASPSSTTVTLP